MVESMEGVYLWESTSSETSTGSSKRQHDIIKRLALETCLNYIKGLLFYITHLTFL